MLTYKEVIDQVHVPVHFHFLQPCHDGVIQVRIKERRWLGHMLVFPQVQVPQGRHPIAVGRLVLAHQQEWFFRILAPFKPLKRQVRHDVRAIAFQHALSVRRDQFWVVVVPLSRQDLPVIKALRRRSQVPFPKQGRFIPCPLQQLGKGDLIPIKPVAVVPEPIVMTVQPCQDHSATGPANTVGAERVPKQHAFRRQRIDARRGIQLCKRRPISPNRMGRVIIAEDEEDVWAWGLLLAGGAVSQQPTANERGGKNHGGHPNGDHGHPS